MSQLKIPASFKILGYTYTVSKSPTLASDDDAVGMANHNTKTIVLQVNVPGRPTPPESVEHTYLHEVVHCILKNMCEDRLHSNEKFVDLFSAMLHQVLTTGEGEAQ